MAPQTSSAFNVGVAADQQQQQQQQQQEKQQQKKEKRKSILALFGIKRDKDRDSDSGTTAPGGSTHGGSNSGSATSSATRSRQSSFSGRNNLADDDDEASAEDLFDRQRERELKRQQMHQRPKFYGDDNLASSEKRFFTRMKSVAIEDVPFVNNQFMNPLLDQPSDETPMHSPPTSPHVSSNWEAPSSWRVLVEGADSVPSKSASLGSARVLSAAALPKRVSAHEDDIGTLSSYKGPWIAPKSWEDPSATVRTRKWHIRVYRRDMTYTTVITTEDITTIELCVILARKLFVRMETYNLYIRRFGYERPLEADEKPLQLQRQMLLDIGYPLDNRLPEQGKKDHSFYFMFIFREMIHSSSSKDEVLTLPLSNKVNLAGRRLDSLPPAVYKRAFFLEQINVSRSPGLEITADFAEQCSSLESFTMCSCELTQLPAAVTLLKSIRFANLAINAIGPSLPPQIERMQNLVELDLRCNSLVTLPAELCTIAALSVLQLSNNLFEAFPLALCALPKLRMLDLSCCRITNIPDDVEQMKSLVILRMMGNCITSISERISQTNLQELDIRDNQISDIQNVAAIASLRKLYADDNLVSNLAITTPMATMRELTMSRNELSTLTVQAASCQLIKLILSYNKLTSFPDTGEVLCNLQELDLSHNQLTRLPPSMKAMRKLRSLNLDNNALSELPSDIGQMIALTQIDVHSNSIKSLPVEIWSLKNLQVLNATSNLIDAFPWPNDKTGLELASTLTELYLADNRLSHSDIFAPITMLSMLRILNVSYNDIDDVPPTIAKLSKLEQLWLSGNMLTTLPEELGRLQSLQRLCVAFNKLVAMPAELAECKNLVMVDLSNNNIRHGMNEWNWNANKSLVYLDLSANSKLSVSPDEILTFEYLKILNIADLPTPPNVSEVLERNARIRRESPTSGYNCGVAESLDSHDQSDNYELISFDFNGNKNQTVYALFEGHLGDAASAYLRTWLPYRLSVEINGSNAITNSLHRALLTVNRDYGLACNQDVPFKSEPSVAEDPSRMSSKAGPGCGAAIVFKDDRTLYVANVGKVEAIVSRNGKAIVLTQRHDTSNPDEIARIRKLGGWISQQRLVNGQTDLTRAFGHHKLLPLVNANPFLQKHTITDADEFVIVADSNFWRYVSHQAAVDIARSERKSPDRACRKLRDFAVAYGASASVTVLVFSCLDSPGMLTRQHKPRQPRIEINDALLARLDAEIDPPTGTVAIVFTDVKNSTLLWEVNAVAMRTAIKVHNEIMRRNLRQFGGYEVKTEGDAFMVAFKSIAAAVKWCLNVQLELLEGDWPKETIESPAGRVTRGENGKLLFRGLSVRMGMHIGEPVSEKDPVTGRMDYFGPPVNRASRVCSAADGGQVVLSEDSWASLMNSLQAMQEFDPVFYDLGNFKLKGLDGAEHLTLVLPGQTNGRTAYYMGLSGRGFKIDEVAARRRATLKQPAPPISEVVTRVQLDRLGLVVARLEQKASIASRSLASLAASQSSSVDTLPVTENEDLLKSLDVLVAKLENAVSALWFQKLGSYTKKIESLLSTGSGNTPRFRKNDPASLMAALELLLHHHGTQ